MEAETAPEVVQKGVNGANGVAAAVSEAVLYPTEETGENIGGYGGLDSAAASSVQMVLNGAPLAASSSPEEMEYPTEETASATTPAEPAAVPAPAPAPAVGDGDKEEGFISALVSSMGFGGNKSSSSSSSSSSGGASAGEDEERAVTGFDDAVKPQPEDGDADGAVAASAAAAAAPLAVMSPGLADRRRESIAAEMKSFLEDSDEEAAEAEAAAAAAAASQGDGESEVGVEGGDGGVEVSEQKAVRAAEEGEGGEAAAPLAADASATSVVMGAAFSSSPKTETAVAAFSSSHNKETPAAASANPQRPASAERDTEFSAGHAKRVIESGVVLERKASITSVVPELKNKSQFSAEDAAATISSGAISERTRKLKEEQDALRQKHATERQDADLPLISAEMKRQQSVKGRAQMHQQAIAAIEGGERGTSKPARGTGKLDKDWTRRAESLEQFVVKYDKPEEPPTSTTSNADAPTRYIPLPTDGGGAKPRGGHKNSLSTVKEREPSIGDVHTAADGASTTVASNGQTVATAGRSEASATGKANGEAGADPGGKKGKSDADSTTGVPTPLNGHGGANAAPKAAADGTGGSGKSSGLGDTGSTDASSIDALNGNSGSDGKTSSSSAAPAGPNSGSETLPPTAASGGGGCCTIS